MYVIHFCVFVSFIQIGFSLIEEETDLNSLSSYEATDENYDIWNGNDADTVVFNRISRTQLETICQNSNKLVYIPEEDVTIDCRALHNGDQPIAKSYDRIKRSDIEPEEGSGQSEEPIENSRQPEDENTNTGSNEVAPENTNTESNEVPPVTEEAQPAARELAQQVSEPGSENQEPVPEDDATNQITEVPSTIQEVQTDASKPAEKVPETLPADEGTKEITEVPSTIQEVQTDASKSDEKAPEVLPGKEEPKEITEVPSTIQEVQTDASKPAEKVPETLPGEEEPKEITEVPSTIQEVVTDASEPEVSVENKTAMETAQAVPEEHASTQKVGEESTTQAKEVATQKDEATTATAEKETTQGSLTTAETIKQTEQKEGTGQEPVQDNSSVKKDTTKQEEISKNEHSSMENNVVKESADQTEEKGTTRKPGGRSLLPQPKNNSEEIKTDKSTVNKASGKDTTILVTLFVAVVVVGALAFGYNFIKKRRQQSADLEGVERASIKRSLQNIAIKPENEAEKKPLMGNSKEVEMVDMNKKSSTSNAVNANGSSEASVKT